MLGSLNTSVFANLWGGNDVLSNSMKRTVKEKCNDYHFLHFKQNKKRVCENVTANVWSIGKYVASERKYTLEIEHLSLGEKEPVGAKQ